MQFYIDDFFRCYILVDHSHFIKGLYKVKKCKGIISQSPLDLGNIRDLIYFYTVVLLISYSSIIILYYIRPTCSIVTASGIFLQYSMRFATA